MLIGLLVAGLGFWDIYQTVTHLLTRWWGDWAWTVIALGEGSALGAYFGWLLIELRGRPTIKVRLVFIAYLTAFLAGSIELNIYASRYSVPATTSHLINVGSFFMYFILGKILVSHLAGQERREYLHALEDARRHAVDIVDNELGFWWRFRAPRMLRRQITSGRLRPSVVGAVRQVVEDHEGTWEESVEVWVYGALGLPVPTPPDAPPDPARITLEGVEYALGVTLQGDPETDLRTLWTALQPHFGTHPEDDAEGGPGGDSESGPEGDPQRDRQRDDQSHAGAIDRVKAKGAAKCSEEELLEALREMWPLGTAKPTAYKVVQTLKTRRGSIGEGRAGRLIATVDQERRPHSLSTAAG
jgi:hypothetical protein